MITASEPAAEQEVERFEIDELTKAHATRCSAGSESSTYREKVLGGGGEKVCTRRGEWRREGDDDAHRIPRVLCGERDKNGFSLIMRCRNSMSVYSISLFTVSSALSLWMGYAAMDRFRLTCLMMVD